MFGGWTNGWQTIRNDINILHIVEPPPKPPPTPPADEDAAAGGSSSMAAAAGGEAVNPQLSTLNPEL